MATLKKWEIPELARMRGLKGGACLILASRLRSVIASSGSFRRTNEVEDLHQLRIAIRRLRYPLETYLPIFKRKLMLKFIVELNALQDAAGHARDLDVLMARLSRDRDAHGWRIARRVFDDLKAERIVLYRMAADAIDLFLVSPLLYDFKNEIRYIESLELLTPDAEPETDASASLPESIPAETNEGESS
jgi:CHAD domain-containing protein